MPKAVLIILFAIIVILGTFAGLLFFAHSEPSTMALDADLAGVRGQIKAADDEDAKYPGGAIKAVISVRREILRTTEAMLTQKRASLVRRIDLEYVVDGKPAAPGGDEKLKEIVSDVDRANASLSKDLGEAERYSGGLLQVMSLMAVATDRLTVAQLNLAYYAAKYGMVPTIKTPAGALSLPAETTPGHIVKDKDAL